MTNQIAKLDGTTFEWEDVGSMQAIRYLHNVIVIQDTFLVVGGEGRRNTERCSYDSSENRFTCQKHPLTLRDYADYPELFAVQSDFCKIK